MATTFIYQFRRASLRSDRLAKFVMFASLRCIPTKVSLFPIAECNAAASNCATIYYKICILNRVPSFVNLLSG
jgi:hypothetical protein